ncbi:MAG: T9SS type A sorting domain-containing protein [Bacteroidia bacterium]
MKKIYTLFSLSIISLFAFSGKAGAQITITDSDMPIVGSKFVTGYDTLPSSLTSVTPGSSGTNVTWNYSSLPTSYRDTDAIVNPSSTPYSSSFPTANLADTTYGTPGYIYSSSSSSSYTIIGAVQSVQGVLATVPFTPPIVELNFPANYGNTSKGTTKAYTPPVSFPYIIYDSAKGIITETYADTIDAWGTITTPLFGSSYNVIRQKHYEMDIDSLYLQSTSTQTWAFQEVQKSKTYQYRWFANGIGDVVAIMTMDTANKKVSTMEWYDGLPDGVNEIVNQNISIAYPNPCTNVITFRYSQQNAQNIYVYDLAGRELGHAPMFGGMVQLNTSGYSGGMYLYHITDNAGNVISNGKFTVVE